MAYEARYVFRPIPGTDLGAAMKAIKECAALWQKHGAPRPRLWSVAAGELGHYALTIEFKNAAEYANAADPLSADPAFQLWQANNVKAGAISWMRSNLMREVEMA